MNQPPADRSSLARRLGVYLFGVAIGLVILGLLQSKRNQAAQRLQAERQAEQERREQLIEQSDERREGDRPPGGESEPRGGAAPGPDAGG